MSVATVQQQLQGSGHGEPIELGPYLSRLCDTLAASMIGDSRPISVKVEADPGTAIRRSGEHRPDYDRTRDQCTQARFPGGGGGDSTWSDTRSTNPTGVYRCPTTVSDCS